MREGKRYLPFYAWLESESLAALDQLKRTIPMFSKSAFIRDAVREKLEREFWKRGQKGQAHEPKHQAQL